MPSIDALIVQKINPFDQVNPKPGNFWGEQQNSTQTVESIHQKEIAQIEASLDLVITDHGSRTVLLAGDSGSGKSYLLGRLKRTLNAKAFFAYIGPWADSDFIWRHILRYTVDSLMHIPEGQQESQLMLWLKGLSAFTKRTLKQRVFDDNIWQLLQSDRQKFIKHLRDTYRQASIYNADIFFGVLHDLTDPELYPLACDWLRGDDLSEESMQALKVKHCIETEDAAKNILANFGKIATETQPLVLCFDQLDNIPRSSDGAQDFQSLFNVNTIVHNENLKNFLVVISIITNTWKQNVNRIQQADRARIHLLVQLKSISLEQSEALWAYQLKPLHAEANPTPDSPIFPLTRQMLEGRYPGGKTLPRYVIQLGRKEYQDYKEKISPFVAKETSTTSQSKVVQGNTISAEFQLLWQQEFKKAQGKVTKISLFSAPELIRMLQEVLAALEAIEIRPKLLSGRYAGYSLSYQRSHQKESIGIVWAEDANMTTFYHVMNACQRAIGRNSCQILYLIRAAAVGHIGLAGNQIYRRNFTGTRHPHIKPDLASVQKLATYHSLVNSVLAHEVILDGKIISLKELEWLTRESEVMHDCHLLQDLDIIARRTTDLASKELDLQPVKNYLFNLVKTQHFMGQRTLKDNTLHHFSELDETQIDQLIAQLCQENKIKIINPKSKPDEQTVLLVT